MTKYLNSHMFTELHLDGIFKYGEDNTLPREVCTQAILQITNEFLHFYYY